MSGYTKECPECEKSVAWNATNCKCGYDFSLEPCPGCDRRIAPEAAVCPHCQYNLILGEKAAPTQVKKPSRKQKKEKKRKKQAAVEPTRPTRLKRKEKVWVPALGRINRDPIDFPELHLHLKEADVTDELLLEWATRLRIVWERHPETGGGYLTNRAIGYIADWGEERVLRRHANRIMNLLGGPEPEG